MRQKIVFLLVLFVGIVCVVSGQTITKTNARALLVELGSMLNEIPESTQQCQALLKQIKNWQQNKLKELEAQEATSAQSLAGEIGSSLGCGCGWLDLAALADFVKGDRLRLKIGGTAAKILIRLLPKGIAPESPQGIIGGVVTVPKSRIVEVSLETDHKGIIQISVHGGPKPWDRPLGGSNGPATLGAVELIRHNR